MFSCRTRGFCPSCHAKRIEEWGEWMRETLLLDVPHRQVVFTIPKMLRVFFKYKRKLLGELCRCALRSLTGYFEGLTGSALAPGVIAAIQTFGDRINLHPHLHFLVTEGGVDGAGVFHQIPRIDDSRLAEMFAREVLADLVRKELLSPEWAERVGKYMIRPLLALERLTFLEPEGKVGYRWGRDGAERETMDYLEFIARVTSHIPDKGQVMVRYYGLYANAHRGKVKKASLSPSVFRIVEEELRRLPSKGWAALIRKPHIGLRSAAMIRKVYEVDPMICSKCGGRMKVVAFITEVAVVDRIVEHLKLTFVADKPPPSHVFEQVALLEAEACGEYC